MQIENDSHYWPPPVRNPKLFQYIESYRKKYIYPPALNNYQKSIIDQRGKYDNNGNYCEVVWNLQGYPTATKIDKRGYEFLYNTTTGKYSRNNGYSKIIYLD